MNMSDALKSYLKTCKISKDKTYPIFSVKYYNSKNANCLWQLNT